MTSPFQRHVNLSLEGLSVMVGMPAGKDLPALTVKSLLATFVECERRRVPCQLGAVANCAIVQWARDEVVDLFLESSANRLFWIDADMVWEPEQFIRLLALSTQRNVVCAAYPAKKDQPTFYVNADKEITLDDLGLAEIRGVGLGFTVMTREVLEQLAGRAPRVRDGVTGKTMAAIFRADSIKGERRGEDMAFFADVRALDYKVWLDPSVDLGHVGMKCYTGSISSAFKPGA